MPNNTIISIVIGATLLVGGGLAGGGLGGTGTSTIESAPSTLEYRADSISAALASKTQEQKTLIKALEIDKAAIGTRDTVVFGKLQYDIEIVNIEQIEGGVQVFARAWTKEGKRIGFGLDGSVEIERFIIINPPILVPDVNGTVKYKDGAGNVTRSFREDPKLAVEQSIVHTISVMKNAQTDTVITSGKVGNTTSTFYSAAGAVSPVDGNTYEARYTNWTTTRDSIDAYQVGVTASLVELRNSVGNGFSATNFNIIRGVHLFDTSSIPDTDNISSATFSVYGDACPGCVGSNQTFYVVASTPASNDNLVLADIDNIGSVSFGLSGTFATAVYNNVTLNSSGITGISKTSVSKFGVRGYYDFTNTVPVDAVTEFSLNYFTADQAGTSQDPNLVVEHATTPPLIWIRGGNVNIKGGKLNIK